MRVAFVGKGGAGKSTIAATYARLLARRGRTVFAVDSDPMPGLSFGLGLGAVECAIPDDAVIEKAEDDDGPRFRLRPGLDPWSALQRYSIAAGDGVRFLTFEKSRGDWGATARTQHAWSQIVNELPDGRFDLIGDLPGGTRQPMTGWAKYARILFVVVDPTPASMATAQRLAGLARSRWDHRAVHALVNRAVDADDAARVARHTGLEVLACLPRSPEVGAADRLGAAPLDAVPESPFVRAIDALVDATLIRFDRRPFPEAAA